MPASNVPRLVQYLEQRADELVGRVRPDRIPFLAFLALAVRYGTAGVWAVGPMRAIESLDTFKPGRATAQVVERLARRPADAAQVPEGLAAIANALVRDAQPERVAKPAPAPPPALSVEERNAQIRAARAEGESYGSIASRLGLSKSTVHAVVNSPT